VASWRRGRSKFRSPCGRALRRRARRVALGWRAWATWSPGSSATGAERRAAAFDPDVRVLVHGDAHDHNTLQVPGTAAFKFVDPDGLNAEPACDLAVPMREWSAELLAGDPLELGLVPCVRLSELTGVEAQAIWEWGAMERLSTGLLATKLGYQPMGREMLAVADAWALGGPP